MHLKDWHPNSDNKVLDLVHPSLYPLIYGRTRVVPNAEATTLDDCIERSGQGIIAPVPSKEETSDPMGDGADFPIGNFHWYQNLFSSKFQWLPCEVDISEKQAKITSYINNLHPHEEKPLYDLISKIITASIPLWNLTLAPLRRLTKEYGRRNYCSTPRIRYTEVIYNPDPTSWPKEEGPQPEADEDEDNDYYLERRREWIEATRKIVLPEPGVFRPLPTPPPYSLKDKYGAPGLQIIVKLANIELTPEKPEYSGGTWHVEGQMNEHIVATPLYYYSSKNITPSSLSFRQQCDSDIYHAIRYPAEQDYDWLYDVFGCQQHESAVQYVGSVLTPEGRLLTFPNILQHRVEPFKLEDPTKPGHRKIVALFLVDPNIKIISTANVPCQRLDWVSNAKPAAHTDPAFPITLDEAKALRLELMEERKEFVAIHGHAFEATSFSLCEH